MTKLISLSNVSKSYQLGDEIRVDALKKINLQIKKGEFVAIVGPSGSGKSTLMHIIGILDKPTTGTVLLNGENIAKLSEDKLSILRNKHVGFVFQSFNLLSRTSALENVELPLIYAGIPKEKRQSMAKVALADVGLSDRINHTPAQLSGGQQQRVAIARALVTSPSLILADEPTGNLDSKSGKEVLELLKNLNKEGNTIVLVTHDKDIGKIAKRIIHMKDGEIINA